MLPVIHVLIAPGYGNERRAPPPSETGGESSRTNVRKWPGKWGRRAEVIPAASVASSPQQTESQNEDQTGSQDVVMDPALWGELQRYIDVEMVAAQLPLHEFFKARSMCKKWNSLPWNRPFLEQHSTTLLPKPYFILHGKEGCHQAVLVKDEMLETWVLKPLPPFAFQHAHTSVAHGVVHTCTYEVDSVVRGTVFNLHTKVFRRLPPLKIEAGGYGCSKIAVDKHSGSYKVLVACSENHQVWVYDSMTGVWTRRAESPAKFFLDEDAAHFDGVMYMKWSGDVRDVMTPPSRLLAGARPCPVHSVESLLHSVPKIFGYNFKHDSWTVLPMTPPALVMTEHNCDRIHEEQKLRGLGEWRGVLRDVTFNAADNVLRVWEFESSGQEWLEVDRMPSDVLEWFFDPHPTLFIGSFRKIIKTSYSEHYILISSNGFPGASGLGKLVLYDMALKSWETLTVAKDWICSCPFGG